MYRSKTTKHKFSKTLLAFAMIFAMIFALCIQLSVFADSNNNGTAAEKISVDPTAADGYFTSVLYDNTNGLPTAEANAIAKTSDGFIWIGSYGGLIRYDGNTFERMDSTNGITSVVTLYADSQDKLWIGTNDSGAAVMYKDQFRRYGKNDGLTSLSIRSIVEDEDGNIYLGTTNGIAVIDGNMELHPLDEPQLNGEYIRKLQLCGGSELLGVTMSGMIFRLKDEKLDAFYSAAETGISDAHSIFPDPQKNGYVYIGTKKSALYHGKLGESFEKTDISPLEYINSLNFFDDKLWICADNGLGVLKDGKFEIIENLPVTSSFECLTTDYQGNIWAASSKQGVLKIVPNQFEDIFEKQHIPREVVNTTCMYDNKLFIGTKSGGIKVIENNRVLDKLPLESVSSPTGKPYDDTDLIKMLDGSRIRSIIRDSKNRMWISTFGENGLIRFDGKTAVKFTAEDGLPSQRARAVYECADGRMLAACTGGVAVIENDKITKVYNEACGISNTEILTVAEGSNGDILVGTDGGGLYVINGDTTEHFSTDNGLPSDVIMRIKKDNTRDIYWLVASNAIAYMTAEHEIKTINKFPYSNNFDLYENGNGDMWILSSSGIYTLPVDELIANGDMSPEFYGRDSGLPCIATSNSYSELTDNGDLYIAGSTGVVKVNIDDPYEKTAEIKISIPYIETDGTKVYPDETGSFRIPSNVKKLTIYSYVYNYSLINPNVTYYLDGFENTAVTVKRSELAPISYTNLRGGSYTFRIRTDSDTGGQVSSYEVKITKEKAFYEHIWFHITALLLIGALFLAGAFGYIHYRNIQFLKKEREQDQFIEEIVEAFAKVIDMKDRYTNGHSFRVANYTRMLAKELGCDDDTANLYYRIALLHDIGKIGVPEDILNKPGKLSDMEFNRIKSHSSLGYDVLKSISIMPEFAKGARAHHERPDGKGYPLGLTLEKIPRVAQIIAVADTFDAMYSDRPYRKRMNFEKAVSIVQEVSGTQLASDVVDAFMRLVAKGEFRAPDDDGGGTTENIDNIRAKFKE